MTDRTMPVTCPNGHTDEIPLLSRSEYDGPVYICPKCGEKRRSAYEPERISDEDAQSGRI